MNAGRLVSVSQSRKREPPGEQTRCTRLVSVGLLPQPATMDVSGQMRSSVRSRYVVKSRGLGLRRDLQSWLCNAVEKMDIGLSRPEAPHISSSTVMSICSSGAVKWWLFSMRHPRAVSATQLTSHFRQQVL